MVGGEGLVLAQCGVLWWGEGDGRLWGSGPGAIAGAIVVCFGWGEGDDQLWGSGRGAIAGCHCSVPV